ncbi:DUF6437 family protein [Sphingomonas solaris]|uniref:DUF64370 domain-containing protein n=1 Tax=Alterirhizorhabdus solaris TaxID=2529389 RepID=A0A558R038_9SPHN|nr:DUF6437 family protein [Sphingomonas solaris]TVV72755.1 hypothetical protein FOY91_13575 [Sphingomonas solaris]
MAKKKPSALDALTRLNEERRLLETRGADVRRAAALELGHAVLDAGGANLGITRLRELVTSAIAGDNQSTRKEDHGGVPRSDPTTAVKHAEESHG